jgi:NAD(P)-dependent dehydrogenase (short-subunit alcohol dehydrogenase family)
MKKVLITGAGTGFGYEVAMRLARKGFGDRYGRNIRAGSDVEARSGRTRCHLASREARRYE